MTVKPREVECIGGPYDGQWLTLLHDQHLVEVHVAHVNDVPDATGNMPPTLTGVYRLEVRFAEDVVVWEPEQ